MKAWRIGVVCATLLTSLSAAPTPVRSAVVKSPAAAGALKVLHHHRDPDILAPLPQHQASTATARSLDAAPFPVPHQPGPQRSSSDPDVVTAVEPQTTMTAGKEEEEDEEEQDGKASAANRRRSPPQKREWEADLEREYEKMKYKMDRELMYDADLDGIWDEETAYDWPLNYEYNQNGRADMLLFDQVWEGGATGLAVT